MHLDNVAYAPSAPLNLISESVLLRTNEGFTYNNSVKEGPYLTFPDGASVQLSVRHNSAFYVGHTMRTDKADLNQLVAPVVFLNTVDGAATAGARDKSEKIEPPPATSATVVPTEFQLLHARLAHCSMDKVEIVAKELGIKPVGSDKTLVCEACVKGKGKHTPIPSVGRQRDCVPGEYIHVDAKGPVQQDVNDNQYVVMFTDESTRFTRIYLTKIKSAFPSAFEQFVTDSGTAPRGLRIVVGGGSTIRTDNDSCFLEEFNRRFLAQKGIAIETRPPHAPQLLGHAERMNQTIFNKARTQLIDAGLSNVKSLWGLSVLHAATVYNMTPHSKLRDSMTPWEALTNNKPPWSMLRRFGCRAYVKTEGTSALEERVRVGMYVGYNATSNSHKVYMPDTRKVISTIHVTFDEQRPVHINEDGLCGHDDDAESAFAYAGGTASNPGDTNGDATTTDTASEGGKTTMTTATTATPAPVPSATSVSLAATVPATTVPPATATLSTAKATAHISASATNVPARTTTSMPAPARTAPSQMTVPKLAPASKAVASAVPKPATVTKPAAKTVSAATPAPTLKATTTQATPTSGPVAKGTAAPVTDKRAPARPVTTAVRAPAKPATQSISVTTATSTTTVPSKSVASMAATRAPSATAQPTTTRYGRVTRAPTKFAMTVLPPRVPLHRDICTSTSPEPVREPRSLAAALKTAEAEGWLKAHAAELNALMEADTWELVRRSNVPGDARILRSLLTFKHKFDINGMLEKLKVRLCVDGSWQQNGVDYEDVSAPVMCYDTLRMLLAFATTHNAPLFQMDVVSAFLNSTLRKPAYMWPPEGVPSVDENGERLVCKLKKALYGLHEAPKAWNDEITKFMLGQGLHRSKVDPGLYYTKDKPGAMLIGLWVDDLVITGTDAKRVKAFMRQISGHYKMVDKGELQWCLGMEVKRTEDRTTLTQTAYIDKVLERFSMSNAKPAPTPFASGTELTKDQCPSTGEDRAAMRDIPYSVAVGSLMHLVSGTRPDIAFQVSQLARFMTNPGRAHWEAAKHLLRYLKGTRELGITFTRTKPTLTLHGYVDASWANDADERKSTTGYVMFMANGPVSWKSRRQKITAASTAEAEYIAASEATREIVAWRQLLQEIGMSLNDATVLHEDNQPCIHLANNPVTSARTKHIDIRHHIVRERVENGEIMLKYIPTAQQLADMLTKSVPGTLLLQHRPIIMGHAGRA
ncbi:MAG: reverse transcriptase domain-containing protein [Burkholderiales bacterium]